MCTVTCCRARGGFVVRMNRDESLARAPGLPPRVIDVDGTRALCPVDPEHGGTWIGANEHGVVVAVLNGDPALVAGAGPWRSRGLVARAALAARSASAAIDVLLAIDPAAHRPFTALAIDRLGVATTVEATPAGLRRRTLALPAILASSSVAHHDAIAARTAQFAACIAGADDVDARLDAFHGTHAPARGPLSVCMHRDDARTVSAACVVVTADAVALAHHDGPPCEARGWTRLALATTATA